jgi:bifunctional non-homologous end joining protein LigD
MQTSNLAQPFSDPKWLFEPKWDGYRALCYLGETIKFSRKNDLTKRFPELQTIQVKAELAIIDGEITAIDEDGLPCFDELKKTRKTCTIVSMLSIFLRSMVTTSESYHC